MIIKSVHYTYTTYNTLHLQKKYKAWSISLKIFINVEDHSFCESHSHPEKYEPPPFLEASPPEKYKTTRPTFTSIPSKKFEPCSPPENGETFIYFTELKFTVSSELNEKESLTKSSVGSFVYIFTGKKLNYNLP